MDTLEKIRREETQKWSKKFDYSEHVEKEERKDEAKIIKKQKEEILNEKSEQEAL